MYLVSPKLSRYDREYYARGKSGRWMKLINVLSFWDRYWRLEISKNSKIVEIGFGNGDFVRNLFLRGFDIYGCDISKFSRAKLAKSIGSGRVMSDLSEADGMFDLVLMFQVLEHIVDPVAYLEKVIRKMRANGKLVIRIPVVDSWEAGLAGKDWYHIDYPNHVTLFTELGAVKLLERVGFKNVTVSKNLFEYRQVLGYSLLTKFGIRLTTIPMIIYQLVTIPILWIFSVLGRQHGVVEIVGTIHSARRST
jgi:SAM-dependent methyltransferase